MSWYISCFFSGHFPTPWSEDCPWISQTVYSQFNKTLQVWFNRLAIYITHILLVLCNVDAVFLKPSRVLKNRPPPAEPEIDLNRLPLVKSTSTKRESINSINGAIGEYSTCSLTNRSWNWETNRQNKGSEISPKWTILVSQELKQGDFPFLINVESHHSAATNGGYSRKHDGGFYTTWGGQMSVTQPEVDKWVYTLSWQANLIHWLRTLAIILLSRKLLEQCIFLICFGNEVVINTLHVEQQLKKQTVLKQDHDWIHLYFSGVYTLLSS